MLMPKIINYLSHLDGVKVGAVHDSHSHYFHIGDAVIRVSDHLAIKMNCPQTLNIVVETVHDVFCVFYGNKIIPVKNYTKLRELLRNFVFMCDLLEPLTEVRQQVKVVEKVVTISSQPSQDSSEWVWVGDLPQNLRDGIVRNTNNVRKMSAHKLK